LIHGRSISKEQTRNIKNVSSGLLAGPAVTDARTGCPNADRRLEDQRLAF
jgi:hypothetical protein